NPPSWGLDRIDQRSLPLDARYTFNATGQGVNAYIIDSGVRLTHQDFGGRAKAAVDFVNDGMGACFFHGTHVAGILGGTAFGVAKRVTLHDVRVLDCNGSAPFSRVIQGIDWVTANHVKPAVANISIGGGKTQ